MTEIPAALGQEVPPFTPHAISVSLPTWKDTVGYEEGEERVVDAMVTGYPRFFIHKSIQHVSSIPCGDLTILIDTASLQAYVKRNSLWMENDVCSVRRRKLLNIAANF